MALSKIQSLINKISSSNRVKKVISDVQIVSSELKGQLKKMNAGEAVKKYKSLVSKVAAKERELQREIATVVSTVKKSAVDVEKNFKLYKSKAQSQRAKIEKTVKAEIAKLKEKKVSKKSPVKKAKSRKKATRK